MEISSLRPGDTVELTVDANAIPKGLYRFESQDGELMIFTVGKEIVFGLALEFWQRFLRPARACRYKRTRVQEFVEKYANLVEELSHASCSGNPQAFSFCMMSPRLMRSVPKRSTADCEESSRFGSK